MRRCLKLVCLAALLLGVVASGPGCGAEADQVELRLFPCEFEGVEPRAVVVELTGFDAQGETVETFEVSFDDVAAKVFDDGYATVGYRKDTRVVRARVRLGWFSTPTAGTIAEAEAVAVYEDLEVPAVGEVLTLGSGASDCSELVGDGDGDPTGDGDPSGDGDGDPTGDGDPSGDGDGDPTGDGDGDPTGDGDGDPSGDGDGDPGEDLPQVGDSCDPFNTNFHCVPELDAQAGSPLFCGLVSMELEETSQWQFSCTGLCPLGSSDPIDGCAGYGHPARCLCEPDMPEACVDATLGCTGDGLIKLCHAGTVVIAQCNNCTMTPGGYYSCTR